MKLRVKTPLSPKRQALHRVVFFLRNKTTRPAAAFASWNDKTGADGKKMPVHHVSEAWWQIRRGELQHVEDSEHRAMKKGRKHAPGSVVRKLR